MKASFVLSKFRYGPESGRAQLHNGCDWNCPAVRHFACDELQVPVLVRFASDSRIKI